MGEVPDFQDLNITHGLCNKCEIPRLKSAKLDLTHALVLKGIQRKLWNAGHRHDLEAAANIIANDAAKAGVRPVDVLIGIIAPLLYRIGEDWKRGTLSIEGEHRFTAFCEKVIDLVDAQVRPVVFNAHGENDIILTVAPGNRHTLAIKILDLWLVSRGKRARIVDVQFNFGALIDEIRTTRSNILLISMSLMEQYAAVNEIVEQVAELPKPLRPRAVIGGYAVKLGLVPPITGADLMADISALAGHL
jgi:methanogenic corrinoid protein MtbC1